MRKQSKRIQFILVTLIWLMWSGNAFPHPPNLLTRLSYTQEDQKNQPNSFEDWRYKKINLLIYPYVNRIAYGFNDDYFINYIPEDVTCYSPSLKMDLFFSPDFLDEFSVKIGIEYRYDFFKTHYRIIDKFFHSGYYQDYVDFTLPDHINCNLQSCIITFGMGGHRFGMDLGFGKGIMNFRPSPFSMSPKDDDKYAWGAVRALEHDLLISESSSLSLGIAGFYINIYKDWMIGLYVVQNYHSETRSESEQTITYEYLDGSPAGTSQPIDKSAAPIGGIISVGYRFHIFSWDY